MLYISLIFMIFIFLCFVWGAWLIHSDWKEYLNKKDTLLRILEENKRFFREGRDSLDLDKREEKTKNVE